MTMADAGTNQLTVAGPPDMLQYIGTLRGSVAR